MTSNEQLKMQLSQKSNEKSHLLNYDQNTENIQQQTDKEDIHLPCPSSTNPNYSIFRARLSMLLATIFTLAITKPVFIAQYLLDRLNEENGGSVNGSSAQSTDHHISCTGTSYNNTGSHSDGGGNHVQAQVSNYMMAFDMVNSVSAFFSCLQFGAIVDLAGRKVALISASFGSLAMAVIVFFIIKFNLNLNLFYLAFGIDGVCGSYFVFIIANSAIIADISVDKKGLIFWIAAFQAIPFTVQAGANISVGYIIKYAGYVITSVVAIIPAVLTFLLSVFAIPETIPVPKQRVTPKKLGAYVLRIVNLYFKDGSVFCRWSMVLSLLIFFVSYVNNMNVSNTDTLYQRRAPLCWDPADLGHYSAYRMLTKSILGMLFLWSLRKLKFISDEQIAMIGALFTVGAFTLEGFARNTWQMYLVPLLLFPAFNVTPVARGVMSSLAGPEKQGVMFSSIALIEVLCMIVASLLYQFYAAMLDIYPGAMYFLMAAIGLVDFLLFFPFFYVYKRTKDSYQRI